MDEIYNDVMKEFVMPLSIYMWGIEGKGWDSMKSENFLAKYVPSAQGHLSIHHDKADITCLIQLSDLNEYEGGGTWFRRQKELIKNNIGYAKPYILKHNSQAWGKSSDKRDTLYNSFVYGKWGKVSLSIFIYIKGI